eukprot:5547182-Prymnesium_polylepis.1
MTFDKHIWCGRVYLRSMRRSCIVEMCVCPDMKNLCPVTPDPKRCSTKVKSRIFTPLMSISCELLSAHLKTHHHTPIDRAPGARSKSDEFS